MRKHIQGVPKKIVDSELFTPGDDNNTQHQYSTSGPIFGPFCDKLHQFLSIFLGKMSILGWYPLHPIIEYMHLSTKCMYNKCTDHQISNFWRVKLGCKWTFFRGKLSEMDAICHKWRQKWVLRCNTFAGYCYHLRG